MKLMQPFMIISDFETYTDSSGIILPYSFAMFTQCMFDINKNKVATYTGENILDKCFENVKLHVKHIDEIKSNQILIVTQMYMIVIQSLLHV